MATFEDIRAKTIGRHFEVDGCYPYECWDYYAQYCIELGIPYAYCTTTGYVWDIWENRKSNGMTKYCDEVLTSQCRKGDIIVFRPSGSCPFSHIGVVASAPTNGMVLVLGQNQDGAHGVVNEVWLPIADAYSSVFRPKALNKPMTQYDGNVKPVNDLGLKYQAHTQDIGWREWVHDGMIAGSVGAGKRLEGLHVDLSAIEGLHLDCKAHIQDVGWVYYTDIQPDTEIGSHGKGRRLEGIEFEYSENNTFTGKVRYQVHLANTGWTNKTDVGFPTGTSGLSKAIEAIKIWLE